MPIVAHSSLPTFDALSGAGEQVLSVSEAESQDIRELHIGLLNMMPDAAMRVTEQQFMRLIGGANQIVQLYIHPFTVRGLDRSPEAQAYIDAHYESVEDLQRHGLDGLVVTGANPKAAVLEDEPFYEPLAEVMEWANAEVTSTLCSCLATHAIVQQAYGIQRRPLQAKRWGVFGHRNVGDHPLLRGINTRYDVPHSRWNVVTVSQLTDAGLRVIAETLDGDAHLATSPDGLRTIFMQGHPEYDTVSLLKEYKRELDRHVAGEIAAPPLPLNYISAHGAHQLSQHLEDRLAGSEAEFPEAAITPTLDNTWTDTAKAVFNNWLGLIYRLTGFERGEVFMPHVDPADPLGLGPAD